MDREKRKRKGKKKGQGSQGWGILCHQESGTNEAGETLLRWTCARAPFEKKTLKKTCARQRASQGVCLFKNVLTSWFDAVINRLHLSYAQRPLFEREKKMKHKTGEIFSF